jgi:hypothetical protein
VAISDLASLVAATQRLARLAKASAGAVGAGALHSLWALSGTPGAGAAAGSINGAIPSRATAGALGQANPAAGAKLYLTAVDIVAANLVQLLLIDRLWHDSGIALNATGNQAITQPALTRYTDGAGNIVLAECHTVWGATPVILTLDYTNSEGVASRTGTVTVDGNPVAGQMWQFNLQAGDIGVQSIQGVSRNVSSGAAGSLGLVIAQPLTRWLGCIAGAHAEFDALRVFREIVADACVCGVLAVNGASTGLISAGLELREG